MSFLEAVWCQLFHTKHMRIVQAYSNRTFQWTCKKCHRVWSD